MRTIVFSVTVACVSVALGSCSSGQNGICFVDDDCGSGLYCCTTPPSRGRCYPVGEECMAMPRVDGGPPIDGGPRLDSGLPPDAGGDECMWMIGSGGVVEDTCGDDREFCSVVGCAAMGTCQGSLLACPGLLDPQCGCDGRTYTSGCEANRAGVSVDHAGACAPMPDAGPQDGGTPDGGDADGGDAVDGG